MPHDAPGKIDARSVRVSSCRLRRTNRTAAGKNPSSRTNSHSDHAAMINGYRRRANLDPVRGDRIYKRPFDGRSSLLNDRPVSSRRKGPRSGLSEEAVKPRETTQPPESHSASNCERTRDTTVRRRHHPPHTRMNSREFVLERTRSSCCLHLDLLNRSRIEHDAERTRGRRLYRCKRS